MAVSKVILNGTTLMDITDTTAEAADVAEGEYYYGADGVKTAGTSSGGGGVATTTARLTNAQGWYTDANMTVQTETVDTDLGITILGGEVPIGTLMYSTIRPAGVPSTVTLLQGNSRAGYLYKVTG